MHSLHGGNGYCLQLANSQGWHLTPTKTVGSWIERLALVMGLETSTLESHPKLFFIQKNPGEIEFRKLIHDIDPNLQENIPLNGWNVYCLKTYDSIKRFQFWSHPNGTSIICHIRSGENDISNNNMRFSPYPIYLQIQHRGGLPFHAALVERNGVGVLLAGKGGTGKSTSCRRLPATTWHTLCDDETLIVHDNQKRYMVHPFPTWSDYVEQSDQTWNVQRHLPLATIFFLEQAETDEIIPIGEGEATVRIYQSSEQLYSIDFMNPEEEEKTRLKKELFNNACELAKTVPAYILRVSLTGQFWKEIEKVL